MSPALLTIAVSAFFAMRGLIGLRKAFFVLVSIAPFLPAYIALAINAEGAGISAFRISVSILGFYGVFATILGARIYRTIAASVQNSSIVFLLMVIIFASKLVSTALNYGSVGYFYWIDETMQSLVVFFFSVYFFNSEKNYYKLSNFIFIGAALNVALVLFEYKLSHPILSGVIEVNVRTLGDEVLLGKVRGEAYRVQALFDNPLSLAEYLLYSLVFALTLGVRFLKKPRILIFSTVVLVVAALLMTGSRFPLLIIVSLGVLCFFLFGAKALSAGTQRRLLVLLMVTIISSTVLLLVAFSTGENYLDYLDFLNGDDASKRASIIQRTMQWAVIPAAVSGNEFYGIFGFGYKSDFLAKNDIFLDNYYFRVLIEGGWISVICFLLIGMYSIIGSFALWRGNNSKLSRQVDLRRFSLFLLLFFVTFFLSKLFLSMNYNNYLLFLFLGALVGMKNIGVRNANIARP